MTQSNKVWVVYVDLYDGGYGSEIYIIGIFDNEEQAIECKNKNKHDNREIKEVLLGVDYGITTDRYGNGKGIYIGGYIE